MKRRLDELLVARGLYPSRSRARDAVLRGTIAVAGTVASKPAALLDADADIAVSDSARSYVSRAALKLIHGLDQFGIDVAGCHAIDIGASAGGFTQVLLERGARRVVAVDVGHGQLDASLAGDPRVISLEGVNARNLTVEQAGGPDVVVADVSFISLKLALPPVLDFARPGTRLVALIKPQFEAGREAIGKGGIIADPAIHSAVCEDIAGWIAGKGWSVIGVIDSPVEGGDGNKEFLMAAEKPC